MTRDHHNFVFERMAPIHIVEGNLWTTDTEDPMHRLTGLARYEAIPKPAFIPGAQGTWDFDRETSTLTICRQCKTILGLATDEPVADSPVLALLSAELFAVFANLVMQCTDRSPIDLQFANTWTPVSGGQPQWLRITGGPSEDHSYHKMSGLLTDISAGVSRQSGLYDLIAFVDHEMRTPLSSLKLYIQLCQSMLMDQPENRMRKYLAKANEMADKATAMLEYFQKQPLAPDGSLQLNKTEYMIDTQLADLVDTCRTLHPDFQFILRPGQAVKICADREKIGQVIQNLLNNAVKYSPEPDSIIIKYQFIQGELCVNVSDHGIGIATGESDKIFEKYYRVKPEPGKMVSGKGIGLYLCKNIIDAHGGKIGYRKRSGSGTTFYFRIPVT